MSKLLLSNSKTRMLVNPNLNQSRKDKEISTYKEKGKLSMRKGVIESKIQRKVDVEIKPNDNLEEKMIEVGVNGSLFRIMDVKNSKIKALLLGLLPFCAKEVLTIGEMKTLIDKGMSLSTVLGINICVFVSSVSKLMVYYAVESVKVFPIRIDPNGVSGYVCTRMEMDNDLLNTMIPGFNFSITSDAKKQGDKLDKQTLIIMDTTNKTIIIKEITCSEVVLAEELNNEGTTADRRRETKSHYPSYSDELNVEKLKVAESYEGNKGEKIPLNRLSIIKFMETRFTANLVNVKGSEDLFLLHDLKKNWLPKGLYLSEHDVSADVFLVGVRRIHMNSDLLMPVIAYELIYKIYEDDFNYNTDFTMVVLHQTLTTSNVYIKPKLIIKMNRKMEILEIKNDIFDDYDIKGLTTTENLNEIQGLMCDVSKEFYKQWYNIVSEFRIKMTEGQKYIRGYKDGFKFGSQMIPLDSKYIVKERILNGVFPKMFESRIFENHRNKDPLLSLKFRDGMLPMRTTDEYISNDDWQMLNEFPYKIIASTSLECVTKHDFERFNNELIKYPCGYMSNKNYDGARSHQCVLRKLAMKFTYKGKEIKPFGSCKECGRSYLWKWAEQLCCGDTVLERRLHDNLRFEDLSEVQKRFGIKE